MRGCERAVEVDERHGQHTKAKDEKPKERGSPMTTNPTRRAHPEAAGSPISLDRLPRRDQPVAQAATAERPTTTASGSAVVDQRPTLTVAEAARLLGVSRWLVQQQVSCGVLPAVRLGRRILIPRARLLAWLDSGR